MFRISKPTTGTAKSARRREELRRTLPRPAFNIAVVLQRPEFVTTAVILAVFMLVLSGLVIWSRDQIKVKDGQIMTANKLKRVDYEVLDAEETSAKKEEARKSSPRIYTRNDSYLTRLEAALQGLPKSVPGKTPLDEINQELRREFELSEDDLRALQPMVQDGESSQEWVRWVRRLVQEQLVRNPLIKSQEYQLYATSGA